MARFLFIFALVFLILEIVSAVGYLRRIAEALEDYVHDDEENKEESEVRNKNAI